MTALPANTTFLFLVEEIRPHRNYHRPAENWHPPETRNLYTPRPTDADTSPATLYRWRNGRVEQVDMNTFHHAAQLTSDPFNRWFYQSATVFTQMPDTDRFVGVPFDARRQDVSAEPGRWLDLEFHHDVVQNTANNNARYSSLGCPAEHRRFATAGTAAWRSLFPARYNLIANNHPYYNNYRDAGLTGSPALILAVVAFSCSFQNLGFVLLNCVGLRSWRNHSAPHGRTQERGVVVTVWRDPDGTTDTNTLQRIERGTYGPFFAPS